MSETFYWHDYETFGANPARDRPVQFAGVRTDADLNVIGEPLVIYCRPANDFLPHPQACLVTGITPQKALAEGLPECEFIARIHDELAVPGTCGVGYNSLRFDDEITRHTLYRNFFDPYAREWQNGNSRWDIIDMVRTANALRPEGIEWPLREDGLPSFRLEDLTSANGISHAAAHDALSDVHATIALARLIKDRQPKLYDYVLNSRDKRKVMAQLDIEGMKPVLHVSGMFGAKRHNIALVVPLAIHPQNRNEIICFDLSADPQALFDLSADELQSLLYMRTEDLPAGTERLGFKSVHLNRCPVLLTPKMADPATAQRLGISGDLCRKHLDALRSHREQMGAQFTEKMQAVYGGRKFDTPSDPDLMLYSGGFFSEPDKRAMARLRTQTPEQLAAETPVFEDKRLPEMLFRYRARNYPDSLTSEERATWEEYRFARLTEPEYGAGYCMEEFQADIEALSDSGELSPDQLTLMEQLLDYSDTLLA
ncbi:Exodeoxyribonuclease I [Halioglobus japonicus]|nr:Exodeoxyribonuclease I [Halioglobus japonicus]